MDILTKIVNHKKQEIAKLKAEKPLAGFVNELKPSGRDFKKAIGVGVKPLARGLTPTPNLIVELKKASPSAGLISKKFDIEKIIKIYNKYASAISVLTDEKFFKGKLEYLTKVKKLSKLPILRKDFIIDEYQIYEARRAGADAILLIAAILTEEQINSFIKTAKKYKMDCLVEVHNLKELKKVLKTKAEIIGINNRNLQNFKIDLNTTLELIKYIPKNKIVVSESGIEDYGDVIKLKNKTNAILVGTSLMRSSNAPLIGGVGGVKTVLEKKIINLLFLQVKICGLKTLTNAQAAASAGADFLGFIFVQGRRRYIEPKNAKIIIQKIRAIERCRTPYRVSDTSPVKIVGVFQNEELNKVNEIVNYLNLDFVQLHGNESPKYCQKIIRPVIKAISVGKKFNTKIFKKYKNNVVSFLLDTLDGGRGKTFNWNLAKNFSQNYPIVLSGGLNINNVKKAIKTIQPQVVDISSGVEDKKGNKDSKKIRRFVKLVKS